MTTEVLQTILEEYIDSIPQGEEVVLTDIGSFNKEELREEIRKGTTVGLRVTQMILDDRHILSTTGVDR